MPATKQPASNRTERLLRPIILIGAGRSGSTLFTRVLNAHPDVQFVGETDFLVARLWREVWDNRFWLNFQHHMRREPSSSRETPVQIPQDTVDAAKRRAARGVRLLLAELMQIEPGVSAWGFKEVWNGNPGVATVPWSVYQEVFPRARWVHLVRDPFDFVRSSVRWNRLPLTMSLLKQELRHWQQVVTWSRQLAGRPDFLEIRFEDLVAAPEATLAPILESAGLAWHPDCRREFHRRVMAARDVPPYATERTLHADEIATIIRKRRGLAPLMRDLGYSAPARLEIQEQGKALQKTLPGPVSLRSLTLIEQRSERSKDATLGKRVRRAAKRLLRPAVLSKVGRLR